MMIHIAQEIKEDSWLQEEKYDWFRRGHGYASTQTHAIPALGQVSPEALYFVVCSVMRGAGLKIPDENPRQVTPPVYEAIEAFIHFAADKGLSEEEALKWVENKKDTMSSEEFKMVRMTCIGITRAQQDNDLGRASEEGLDPVIFSVLGVLFFLLVLLIGLANL